jgi:hypothetical protein
MLYCFPCRTKGEKLSLIFSAFLLVISGSESPGTPEDFLELLSVSGADFWIEHRLGSEPSDEGIQQFFRGLSSISVTPGRRVFEESPEGYRVLFPESRWGYRKEGRFHSSSDTTIVEWTAYGFRWSRIPVFAGPVAIMAPTQGVCGGLILTGVIIGIALMVLGHARRRYRE